MTSLISFVSAKVQPLSDTIFTYGHMHVCVRYYYLLPLQFIVTQTCFRPPLLHRSMHICEYVCVCICVSAWQRNVQLTPSPRVRLLLTPPVSFNIRLRFGCCHTLLPLLRLLLLLLLFSLLLLLLPRMENAASGGGVGGVGGVGSRSADDDLPLCATLTAATDILS